MLKHCVGQQYTQKLKLSASSSRSLNAALESTKLFQVHFLDFIRTRGDRDVIIFLF